MTRSLLALLLIACCSTAVYGHEDLRPTLEAPRNTLFPPAQEELTVGDAGNRLAAMMYIANGVGPHPTVVLAHGLPGHEKNLDIAQAARRAGFNVLFFNYSGAWGSEGIFRLTQMPADLARITSFLRDNATRYRIDSQRISVIGHSMGGFTALAAGVADPSLRCLAALAPANLGLLAEGLRASAPWATAFLKYADTLFMLKGFNGKAMRKDLLSQPPTRMDIRLFAPRLSGRHVLMITGTEDTVLPPETMFIPAVNAYRRNGDINLRVHRIPGDHAFSYSRLLLAELILDWLQSECN